MHSFFPLFHQVVFIHWQWCLEPGAHELHPCSRQNGYSMSTNLMNSNRKMRFLPRSQFPKSTMIGLDESCGNPWGNQCSKTDIMLLWLEPDANPHVTMTDWSPPTSTIDTEQGLKRCYGQKKCYQRISITLKVPLKVSQIKCQLYESK